MTNNKIIGAGAALMDILLKEEFEFVNSRNVEIGGMSLLETVDIEKMMSESRNQASLAAGGSACNTLVGLSYLGVDASFCGVVGDDFYGKRFVESISASGLKGELPTVNEETGRVLSCITPDGQRTMFTSLGAAAMLAPDHLNSLPWGTAEYVLIEGYLAYNSPVFEKMFKLANEYKVKVILDLSAATVIRDCKEVLTKMLNAGVGVLVANEEEGEEFAQSNDETLMLAKLANFAEIAVLKLGSKGVKVKSGNETSVVKSSPVKALDTTGAGDSWMAGFIAAILKGRTLSESAEFGNKVGAEMVQVLGAGLSAAKWTELKKEL
jgi:sugar/nucleoside kinase (ribokinase family)